MNDEEFYRSALVMIEGCKIEVDGLPINPSSEVLWLRELAKEALNGIDPTTGKERHEQT